MLSWRITAWDKTAAVCPKGRLSPYSTLGSGRMEG